MTSTWRFLEASAIARAADDPLSILSLGAFPASREARYVFDVIARWPVLAKASLEGIVGVELEFDLATAAITQRFAHEVFHLVELAMAPTLANAA